MQDPINELKKAYRWLGDEWTEAAEHGMRRWLEGIPQDKFGKHSYSLKQPY